MDATKNAATVVLRKRDLRGSKLRCLMLTSMPYEQSAATLTELASPFATVDPKLNKWMPRGFLNSEEAKLGESPDFLPKDLQNQLTKWWLIRKEGANTPNWDLVSACRVSGKPGIILVEAKAHESELEMAGKKPGNKANDLQIRTAIAEASRGLNSIIPGWQLCCESHYQVSNRFAWAWKLATLGVPTVLIYLGFIGATEMSDRGRVFQSRQDWQSAVHAHTKGIVPTGAWGQMIHTSGAPMWPLIRSLELFWRA